MKNGPNNQAEWEEIAGQYKKPHFRKLYVRAPAVLKMLGNVRGKTIIDLGCGDGFYSRILAQQGAKVTGIDFSSKAIKLAQGQELKDKLSIKYFEADIADLHFFDNNSFNLALAEMVIVNIPSQEKYLKIVKEVKRILKPGGQMVISKGHPANFLRHLEDQSKYFKLTYSREVSYFDSLAPQNVEIEIDGQPVRFTNYHRTLEDFLNPWFENGFLVSDISEPKPTLASVKKYPEQLRDGLRVPFYIIIKLKKFD